MFPAPTTPWAKALKIFGVSQKIIDADIPEEKNLLKIHELMQIGGVPFSFAEEIIESEEEIVLEVNGKKFRMLAGNIALGQMIQIAMREGEEVRLTLSGFYGTLTGEGTLTLEELGRIVTALKNAPGSLTLPITYLDHLKKEKRTTVTFEKM